MNFRMEIEAFEYVSFSELKINSSSDFLLRKIIKICFISKYMEWKLILELLYS